MNVRPKCSCSGVTSLMFSCSGAADLAEIGDRAVRSLHEAGAAKMFCLAGISGKVELIEVNTRGADRILVLDGCDSDCAKKTMEFGGFTEFIHFRVSDLGMEKGKTPVTDDRIATVAAKLRELLGTSRLDVPPAGVISLIDECRSSEPPKQLPSVARRPSCRNE